MCDSRLSLGTFIVLFTACALLGCERELACGLDLAYDRSRHRCVCPNGGAWEATDGGSGVCVLEDGSTSTLESMRDAMATPLDACSTVFFRDFDGDGTGNPHESVRACSPPSGYVAEAGDCDDNCATCNVDGVEACNSRDDDCDGNIDEGLLQRFFADSDGDGFGADDDVVVRCSAPAGYVDRAGDCNDACTGCHPDSLEACDRLDNDCDGHIDEGLQRAWYADCDRDGFAAAAAVAMTDCTRPEIAPAACPGGTWTDVEPAGATSTDCRDDEARAFPGQTQFFTSAITSAPAGRRFDFNCDGSETPERSSGVSVPCSSGALGCRGGGIRPNDGTTNPVACGAVGIELTCTPLDVGSWPECDADERPYRMACR